VLVYELLPRTGVAREVMGMNPLNYMEKKLRTTKIITVNNSQDKGLLVRFPLNTRTRSDHPHPDKCVQNAQICYNIVQKCLVAGLRQNTLKELTTLLQPP